MPLKAVMRGMQGVRGALGRLFPRRLTTSAEQFEIHFGSVTRKLWADLARKDDPMKAHEFMRDSKEGDRHVACGGLLRVSRGQPVIWCQRCGDEIAVSIAGVPR